MRYYKVFTDFTNYISIDETELEKALKAFQKRAGAMFQNGATTRIEVIVPDDVRMMGWNTGYKPQPEELGEIARNPECLSARKLMATIKEHFILHPNESFKLETSNPVRLHTKGLQSLAELLPENDERTN